MARQSVDMVRILDYLSSKDQHLAKVISLNPVCTLGKVGHNSSNFISLVESVVSQQLSVRASATIFGRLTSIAEPKLSPESILKLSDSEFRACGLSAAKTKTIRGLSLAAVSKAIDFETLQDLRDDDIISKELNSLWGIGPWTVDMFMMHQLGRLDVWPMGDAGVKRGWAIMHELLEQAEQSTLYLEGEKFRPYRSVVAWYCWKAADSKSSISIP